MGIYDRDYYRGSGHSFLGSFLERGTVCKWLVGINFGFFVIQLLTRTVVRQQIPGVPPDLDFGGMPHVSEPFTHALWLNVDDVLHGQVWRLLTCAFLHDTTNPWHILFNMLVLWWFGSDVEDIYGPKEFLTFYLTAAVASSLAYVAAVKLGFHENNPALGASGAVTAALLVCACHYPTKIIQLFFFLPIPIWIFVIFSVAKDAFSLLGHTDNGTATSAHLGGAAFGFLYYKFQWRLTNLWPQFKAWKRRRAQPRLRVYRDEAPVKAKAPVSVAAPVAPDDEQLEAKMDAILEKISRVGKENLTENELKVLQKASEKFKRRRQ
jgi:membrane associated rhomboid family serine protease